MKKVIFLANKIIIGFVLFVSVLGNVEAQNVTPNNEIDFRVTLTADNAGVVIVGYNGTRVNVVIPDTIQGMPVREIGNNAFRANRNITSVVIPEGVTIIGSFSFGEDFFGRHSCEKLSSVSLPSTLTHIGQGAFSGCTALTVIILPAGLKDIGSQAFSGTGLTSFPNWPSEVTVIRESVFRNSKLRGNVIIPEGVIEIDSYAFMSCKDITGITFPSTIRTIKAQAFDFCSLLANVSIPESVVNISFNSSSGFRDSNMDLGSQAALRRVGYRGSF
ncbi:MAG: leucine-rich repeat domain-containing protein [Treponema sp.]|nr:leucine-rich repeat domain-containing protein [Treponema sp.]